MTSRLKYRAQEIISELKFETSRSSGSGGQHVNKTESRVTVLFDLNNSTQFSDSEKIRLARNLGSRLKNGVFRVNCQENRSQHRNKEIVTQWLLEALDKALFVPKVRKKKKISRNQKEKRLKNKKRHSQKKDRRKKNRGED